MTIMHIKLNQGYVAPETDMVSVVPESGICAGSKEQVVKDDNTITTIEKQTDGHDFELGSWDN